MNYGPLMVIIGLDFNMMKVAMCVCTHINVWVGARFCFFFSLD